MSVDIKTSGIDVKLLQYTYPSLIFQVMNSISALIKSVSVELNSVEIAKFTTELDTIKELDLTPFNDDFNEGDNIIEIKVNSVCIREGA